MPWFERIAAALLDGLSERRRSAWSTCWRGTNWNACIYSSIIMAGRRMALGLIVVPTGPTRSTQPQQIRTQAPRLPCSIPCCEANAHGRLFLIPSRFLSLPTGGSPLPIYRQSLYTSCKENAEPRSLQSYMHKIKNMRARISLPRRERHNSPLAAPCPFPRARISSASFCSPQLLVLPRLQPHDHISLAGPQRQHIEPGSGAKRADGLGERRGSVPLCL